MTSPLLVSKLKIPASRSGLVSRPRLIQHLNSGLDKKLTLISASTGYGKTTIASAWINQCDRPAAWLSLDENDNDPHRFLHYLVKTLQCIQPQVGEFFLDDFENLYQKKNLPPCPGYVETLVSEIAGIQPSFILVLDDFHTIINSAVQDILRFLLSNQPQKMHLVISTRVDPPWPLARLRANNEMNELRANDLRFTLEETVEFLNERMGLELTELEVASLETRTEGWIASLQLAGLSMQGPVDRHQFIKNLTGSNRFISDYLIQEVLEKQPPNLKEFLLTTSILEELNADLCNDLLNRNDSQTILVQLEESNLFLQSLDVSRDWYRYHHLFADLLQIQLRQVHPNQISNLHRRASQWFEKNGMIDESISHSLKAKDFDQVINLVQKNALSMLDSGELTTLLGWLDSIPEDLVNTRPWFCIYFAWALAFTDQPNRAEKYLQKAENALSAVSQTELRESDQEHIQGYIFAIRTFIAQNKGEMNQAVEYANNALEFLPNQDYKTRCHVAQTLGNVLLFTGDLAAASQALQRAIDFNQKMGDQNRTIDVLCDLAGLQWMLGQLRASEASCREALHLAENDQNRNRYTSGTDIAHARLSRILLEWNDAEAAMDHVKQGISLSNHRGQAGAQFFCLVTQAEIQISNKDAAGAVNTFEKARPKPGSGASWHTDLIDQFEAEALFSQGDVIAAERWMHKNGWKIGEVIPADQANRFEFVARILIARQEYQAALDILDHLLIQEQAKGVKAFVLMYLISQAIAWQGLGNMDCALAALDRAFDQAEPEGYIRTFTDRGEPMRELLQKAAKKGLHPQYANQLLAVLNNSFKSSKSSTKVNQEIMTGAFSERELEILRLLDMDLSAPEIADKLVISTNTVRTHIKSIYQKLNAHSRYEAILQARNSSLL